mgnify:CR=1 FL=1
MTDDVVVKVEHVSKKFAKSLKRSMLYGVSDISRNALGMGSKPEKLREGEFWAVDDVSFELRKGEALGSSISGVPGLTAKEKSKGHIEHAHSLSKATNPTSSVRCVRNET